MAYGDRVQRLPQQLDLAVLGHETASKQVDCNCDPDYASALLAGTA
jgi:hypothetical protein